MADRNSWRNNKISIELNAFEVYNREILDLLNNGSPVEYVTVDNRTVLKNLRKVEVTSIETMEELIERTLQTRSISATSYNPNSSRSHTFFQLQVNMTYSNGSKEGSRCLT